MDLLPTALVRSSQVLPSLMFILLSDSFFELLALSQLVIVMLVVLLGVVFLVSTFPFIHSCLEIAKPPLAGSIRPFVSTHRAFLLLLHL
mmetsp:Transcript_1211/g.1254  ORF Transcript_1211/g.1254 Transcript_1211/m.1254 type:complete len:89 (+) Transcript_1211:71-337(+)